MCARRMGCASNRIAATASRTRIVHNHGHGMLATAGGGKPGCVHGRLTLICFVLPLFRDCCTPHTWGGSPGRLSVCVFVLGVRCVFIVPARSDLRV